MNPPKITLHIFTQNKELLGIGTTTAQADELRAFYPDSTETILNSEAPIPTAKLAGLFLNLSGCPAQGGRARNKNLSPQRRAEIARKAAMKRWANKA